jgi:SAM-dependent methyltransferase
MLTPQERETIQYYDDSAQDWADKHGKGETISTFAIQMKKLFELAPTGIILEIGGGHGKEAALLIDHYGVENYVGVDASEGLLRLAKERNPNAKFIHSTVYDLDGIEDATVNAFWISAMLIHVPKDRLQEALDSLKGKLADSSYGFFSILDGDADMQNSRRGRYYSLWTKKDFTAELEKAGFSVEDFRRYPGNGNDWLGFIVKFVAE